MSISSWVITDVKVKNNVLQRRDVGELAITDSFTARLIHQTTRSHEPFKQAKIKNFFYPAKSKTHDEARYHLFYLHALCDEALPQNHDPIQLHMERCNYQMAVYRRALQQSTSAPSPVGYVGRTESRQYSCQQSRCETSRYIFRTSDLSCTDLCLCIDCINYTITASHRSASSDEEDDNFGDD